jgi:hypothetical protein
LDSVNIIISVKDVATKEIDKVKKSLGSLDQKTTETAKNTEKNEAEAARATAIAHGLRQRAIQGTIQRLGTLSNSLKFLYSGSFLRGVIGTGGLLGEFGFAKVAAESDQVRISFQNTFGNKAGSILDSVRTSVKGMIDDTTLMKQAIQANLTGIRGVNELPEIFKLGAVASQRLGISAEEGVERARRAVVEFNEGAMEQLGILNKLDPTYRTQLAMIEKSTKGLGQYLTIQYKLNYVLEQARKRFGDNYMVLETNMQAFQFLGAAIINVRNLMGYLLGDALAPMARGFAMALSEVSRFIGQLRNIRVFREGTIAIVRFTTALMGSLAAVAAVRAGLWALQLVFSGPFGLLGAFAAIALAMKVSSMGTGNFIENLKILGKEAMAVFQLITSYDPKTGLAKVAKDLADTLGPDKMGMVLDATQKVLNVLSFFKGVGEGIESVFNKVINVLSRLGLQPGLDEDKWKSIGTYVGEIGTGLVLLGAPLSAFLGTSLKILATYREISALVAAIRGAPLVTAAAGAGAAAAVPPLLAYGAGVAIKKEFYHGQNIPQARESGSEHYKGSVFEHIFNSLGGGRSSPPSTSTAPAGGSNSDTNRHLAKIAAHMENIDNKTTRKDVISDKLVGAHF